MSRWIGSLVLIGSLFIDFIQSQDVFSCGGFIKSSVPIDFGRVWVKLYTPEGNLKYETDSAPNNGYYMIPVYSKGAFIVRVHPPTGWKFDPESISINVDGATDPCSKGEDINFNFNGFRIAGKVRTSTSTVGPKGFEVILRKASDKSVVQSTQTTNDGLYSFDSVFPDNYIITTREDQHCSAKSSVSAALKNDALQLENDLEISGYALTGSVADKGQAVSGVQLILFSSEKLKLQQCDSTLPIGFSAPSHLSSASVVCVSKSQTDGSFSFPCVPPGQYSISPFYESQGVRFDVVPKIATITVKNAPTQLEESFRVSGFSVVGKVLWKNKGEGISGATVSVNGALTTQTSVDGSFLLEQITTAKYEIKVQKDDMEFSILNVDLSPKNPVLPAIVPEKFNLCGDVLLEHFPSSVPKLTQRKLLLTSAKTKDVVSLTTDQNGHFCKLVQRGKYTLAPQLLPSEKEAGLSLIPSSLEIDLADGPVKNVVFSQFEATVSGQVQCLTPCKKIEIRLFDSGEKLLKSTVLGQKQQLHNFQLSGLLPGKYVIMVQADHFCWEQNKQEIEIGQNDISGLHFRQTGFGVELVSTNEAKLNWVFSGNKVVKGQEKVQKGNNWFCLPVDGKYQFSLESCHKFQREKYEYDTGSPEPLSLFAVKHLVSGSVKMKHQSDDISMQISSEKRPEDVTMSPLTLLTPPIEGQSEFIYKFDHFAESSDTLTLTPTSGLFLFSPSKRTLEIADDCIPSVPAFIGEKGIFLLGSVTPPLADVDIQMKHPTEPATFNAVSDANGEYSIGPLRSYEGFELVASKEGYLLSRTDRMGHFQAFKLSELTIKVSDSEKNRLIGVLISVSGGENYRSNSLTQDTGLITFVGLSPGQYFIRPILKEYSFEPATKIVAVKEGSTEVVELVGTRVAFSCLGQVRHLGGQPVPHQTVEAVSEGCNQLHEEDVTGEDGKFRVRGLNPGCSYQLRVKQSEQAAGGTYPQFYNVQVQKSDVESKDFVLRPVSLSMEVAGRVVTDREYLSSLRVALYKDQQPDIAVHSVNLQQASMFFFQNIPIDGTLYVARLETTLSESQFEKWRLPEVAFKANESFRFVRFEFAPKKKPLEVEISKASYIALPLTLLIIALAYNHVKVLPFVLDAVNSVSSLVRGAAGAAMQRTNGNGIGHEQFGEFDTPEQSQQMKRRIKPRKT